MGRGGGDGTRGGTCVEGPRGRVTSQKEGGDAGLWRAEVEGSGGAVDRRMLWWAWGHSLWPDRGAVA